jgi:hypothetical protein
MSKRSYKASVKRALGIKPLPKVLRPKRIRKRVAFRLLVESSDKVNIRFQDMFGLNPKRKILEKKQDFVTMRELDNTIGKSLGIK